MASHVQKKEKSSHTESEQKYGSVYHETMAVYDDYNPITQKIENMSLHNGENGSRLGQESAIQSRSTLTEMVHAEHKTLDQGADPKLHEDEKKSTIRTSAKKYDTDSDSEDDDDLEIERMSFTAARSSEYIKAKSWEKAESCTLEMIKLLEKYPGNGHIFSDPDHAKTLFWTAWLIRIQMENGKYRHALLSIKLLEGIDLATEVPRLPPGEIEYWEASCRYSMGEWRLAKRCCKKAIRIKRSTPGLPPKGIRKATQLMIHILKDSGEDQAAEIEFYESIFEKTKDTESKASESGPQHPTVPDRKDEETSVSEVIRSPLNPINKDPSLAGTLKRPSRSVEDSHRRQLLSQYGLEITPDGSIMSKDNVVSPVILGAIESNNLAVADVLFDDPKMREYETLTLDNGPNIPQRLRPLYLAAWKCKYRIFQLLIQKGADMFHLVPGTSKPNDKSHRTIVDYIFTFGGVGMLDILILNGYPIEGKKTKGFTYMPPLQTAVICKQVAMVEYLLNAGAEVNASDSKQNTALHLAAQSNSYDIVKLLLAHGANKQAKNSFHYRPRECAHNLKVIGLFDNP